MSPQDDPKRRVLDFLKRAAPSTTKAVADALQVTDVAARQHLFDLTRNGLVTRTTAAPSGKGRPGVLWRLTPLANDLFPDRHDALTVDLISGIRAALGEDGLQSVIEARTERQLQTLRARIRPSHSLRERVEALAEQRTVEGYMAEVIEQQDGSYLLVEHHCPICDAASSCQLFCVTELDLFRDAIGPDAQILREQHLLSGDDRCVYHVMPA